VVFIGLLTLLALCWLLAWAMGLHTSAAPDDLVLGDLSRAAFVEIVESGSGEVAMSGELRQRVDGLGNVEKDAALLGKDGRLVIGEIEIDIPRDSAAERRQELEIDVISLNPRTTYQVVVDARRVARFTTDDRGSVDIEFDAPAPPAS
jgi:hypothetical protein